VCPVEEKAKIDICESDQWVAGFDSANFGLEGKCGPEMKEDLKPGENEI